MNSKKANHLSTGKKKKSKFPKNKFIEDLNKINEFPSPQEITKKLSSSKTFISEDDEAIISSKIIFLHHEQCVKFFPLNTEYNDLKKLESSIINNDQNHKQDHVHTISSNSNLLGPNQNSSKQLEPQHSLISKCIKNEQKWNDKKSISQEIEEQGLSVGKKNDTESKKSSIFQEKKNSEKEGLEKEVLINVMDENEESNASEVEKSGTKTNKSLKSETVRSKTEKSKTDKESIDETEKGKEISKDQLDKLMNKKELLTRQKTLRQTYSKNSLFIFALYGKPRILFISIIEHRYFENIVRFFLFLNLLTFFIKYHKNLTDEEDTNNIFEQKSNDMVLESTFYLELICNLYFFIEMCLRILAMGLLLEKKTFLRNGFHFIDFISTIFSFFQYVPDFGILKIGNVIKMLRPIRFVATFQELRKCVIALLDSLYFIMNYLSTLLFLLIFFGILGTHLYMGVTEYRCRFTELPPENSTEWLADSNQPFLCGVLQCSEGTFCRSPYDYDLPKQEHENQFESLLFDRFNFDTFYNSFLTNLTFLTFTGWGMCTNMFWHTIKPYTFAMFSLSQVFIVGLIYSNLVLAEFYESFIICKSGIRKEIRENTNDSKASQIFKTLKTAIENARKNQRRKSMFKQRKSIKMEEFNPSEFEEKSNIQYNTEIIILLDILIHNRFLKTVFNWCAVLNIFLLLISSFSNNSNNNDYYINFIDKIFSIFFIIESCFALIHYGPRMYFDKNSFQKVELMIFLLVVINLALEIKDKTFFEGNVLGLRPLVSSLKFLRICKILVKSSYTFCKSIGRLINELIKSMMEISDFIIIIIICLIISSLMGIELLKCDSECQSHHKHLIIFNRFNYNDIWNSILSTFLIFINEEWHLFVIDFWNLKGSLSIIFFVFILIVCYLFVMKMFTALLINHFCRSASVKFLIKNSKDDKYFTLKYWIDNLKSLAQIIIKIYKKIEKYLNNHCLKNCFKKPKKLIIEQKQTIVTKPTISNKLKKTSTRKSVKISENKNTIKNVDPPLNESNSKFESDNNIAIKKNLNVVVTSNNDIKKSPITPKSVQLINSSGFQGALKNQPSFKKNSTLNNLTELNRLSKMKSASVIHLKSSSSDDGTSRETEKTKKKKKSLFMFNPENKIRIFANFILKQKIYEYFILFIVSISCFLLCFKRPFETDKNGINYYILNFEIFIFSIFFIEFLLKIIAFGFLLNGKQSYILNGGNILDFSMIILNIIEQIYGFSSNYKSLRMLKFFFMGPYKRSLKLVSKTMVVSLPNLIKISLITIYIMYFFTFFAVKYFKNAYYYCNIGSTHGHIVVLNKYECYDNGGDWLNKDFNFDNIFNGMSNLFNVASSEGWIISLFDAYDSTKENEGPVVNNNKFWSIFFIIYFIVSTLVIFNVVVGIIVEKYFFIKLKSKNFHLLSDEQIEWAHIRDQILIMKPIKQKTPPKNIIRRKFYELSHLKWINYFFMISNIINTLLYLLFWHRQESTLNLYIERIGYACTLIFFFEFVIVSIAKGYKYFLSVFHLLDMFIILYSFIVETLDQSGLMEISPGVSSFARVTQTLRMLKLIAKITFLRKMFTTIQCIIPQVANLLTLLIIVMVIYSLIGMELFVYLRPQKIVNGIDIHFQDFFYSFFTLMRVVTVDSWFPMVSDCGRTMQSDFYCVVINNYDDFNKYGLIGCGSKYSLLYFYSFDIIVVRIVINIFIAMILSAAEEVLKIEKSSINRYQLSSIREVWMEYDPLGYGFINYKDFWLFSSKIAMTFGVGKNDLLDVENRTNFLNVLEIPVFENTQERIFCYKFQDVILKLAKVSIILKYGITELEMLGDKSGKKTKKNNFFKCFENKTPSIFKETRYLSGDMSHILRILINVKKWRYSLQEKKKSIFSNSPKSPLSQHSRPEKTRIFDLKSLIEEIKMTKKLEEENKNNEDKIIKEKSDEFEKESKCNDEDKNESNEDKKESNEENEKI